MAKQFAPKKDEKGHLYWENPGDEARFVRFFKLSGEYATARAPYESPRLSAIAAGQLGGQDDDDGSDPGENLMRIVEGWIEANKAERAEKAIDVTPLPEPEPAAGKPSPSPTTTVMGRGLKRKPLGCSLGLGERLGGTTRRPDTIPKPKSRKARIP